MESKKYWVDFEEEEYIDCPMCSGSKFMKYDFSTNKYKCLNTKCNFELQNRRHHVKPHRHKNDGWSYKCPGCGLSVDPDEIYENGVYHCKCGWVGENIIPPHAYYEIKEDGSYFLPVYDKEKKYAIDYETKPITYGEYRGNPSGSEGQILLVLGILVVVGMFIQLSSYPYGIDGVFIMFILMGVGIAFAGIYKCLTNDKPVSVASNKGTQYDPDTIPSERSHEDYRIKRMQGWIEDKDILDEIFEDAFNAALLSEIKKYYEERGKHLKKIEGEKLLMTTKVAILFGRDICYANHVFSRFLANKLLSSVDSYEMRKYLF